MNLMKNKQNLFLAIFIIFFFFLFIYPKQTLAIRYSLILPSETLTRGQTFTATINIDTEGETITQGEIGMTYETQYLEYVNTIAGESFSNLTTETPENGKLIFRATSAGFNGSGVFAQVNFRIIADAPGQSQLCVLWEVPSNTTPQPTSPPQLMSPTAIPTSGSYDNTKKAIFWGGGLIVLSLGVLIANTFFFNNQKRSFSGANKNKKSLQ